MRVHVACRRPGQTGVLERGELASGPNRRRACREVERRGGAERDDPSAGAKELPPGWKAAIDAAWVKFLKDDPTWPQARADLIALGPPAPLILTENLFRAHVLAFDAEDRRLFMRTRLEILERRGDAVPFLVAGLASGGGDTTVRNLSEDLLAAMGDAAAEACVAAWPTTADERGRRSLARVMKKSKSRAAVERLVAIAGSDAPFATRLEAVEGLGEIADPRGFPRTPRVREGRRSGRSPSSRVTG
jgi:hypothetical protein